MSPTATFLAALTISIPFPHEWLGDNLAGHAVITYKLTDICDFEILGIDSDPPDFDLSFALKYLHYATASDRVTDNWDFIFRNVPGAKEPSSLSLKNRIRTVRYGGDTIVCNFDGQGEFKSANFEPDSSAIANLAALPSQQYKFTIRVEH